MSIYSTTTTEDSLMNKTKVVKNKKNNKIEDFVKNKIFVNLRIILMIKTNKRFLISIE